MHIILLSITVIIAYSLSTVKHAKYFKIGKFCLFINYKLNVKWPVTQIEWQRGLQLSSIKLYHLENLIYQNKRLNESWT